MSLHSYQADRLDRDWVERLFRTFHVPRIGRTLPRWAEAARRGGPLCILDGRPYRVREWDYRHGQPVLTPALPSLAIASGLYGTGGTTTWNDGSAVNPGGKKSATVMGWARPNAVSVYKYVVANGGTNTNAWGLSTGTSDGTRARAQNALGVNSFEDAAGSFPANAWTHIGSTFDGTDSVTGLALYVNGALRGTSSASSLVTNGGGGGGGFTIGGRDSTGDAFTGEIDLVKLWYHATLADAELTAQQMASEQWHYWPQANLANLVLFVVTTPSPVARMGSQMDTAPSTNTAPAGTNHPPVTPAMPIFV